MCLHARQEENNMDKSKIQLKKKNKLQISPKNIFKKTPARWSQTSSSSSILLTGLSTSWEFHPNNKNKKEETKQTKKKVNLILTIILALTSHQKHRRAEQQR